MERWAAYDEAQQWIDAIAALPDAVRDAICAQARTPCPECARCGVPQSWAVAAARAARP